MTSTLSPPERDREDVRTYAHWRRPASPGLWGLGLIGTVCVFAAICLVVLTSVFVGFVAALSVAALSAVALVPLLHRDRHHRTAWHRLMARLAWRNTVASGGHVHRAGALTRIEKCPLPGLAAAAELVDATDLANQPYALISHPKVGHLTAVIGVEPEGVRNVDTDTVNTWVAHWGGWLALLGEDSDIVGASVTVEASPGTGLRLRQEIESNLAPPAENPEDPYSTSHMGVVPAPPIAIEMFNEVMENLPKGSAAISAWVTITWARTAIEGSNRRRSLEEMVTEIGHRLPGLVSALRMTGAGDARSLTAPEITSMVRTAFDTHVAGLVEQTGAFEAAIPWSDAGPRSADEAWDHYSHDGSVSMSWEMTGAPRSAVQATALLRLLQPHQKIQRKRVTMLYRPYGPESAANVVDQDLQASSFNARAQKSESPRLALNVEAARRTATEEASGAGLTRFGMIVTVTLDRGTDLTPIATTVQHVAAASRIRLRPAYGQQATYFLAGLPLGIVLPSHVRVPTEFREMMQ